MARLNYRSIWILHKENNKQQIEKQKSGYVDQTHIKAPNPVYEYRNPAAESETQELSAEHETVTPPSFVLLQRANGKRINSDVLGCAENIIQDDDHDQQLKICD